MVDIEEEKKRKNSSINKIGMAEDKVNWKEVSQATQVLNASSVTSMTIMQRSANRLSVSVVVRSNILQKITNLIEFRWLPKAPARR